jgi:hypothetical protein
LHKKYKCWLKTNVSKLERNIKIKLLIQFNFGTPIMKNFLVQTLKIIPTFSKHKYKTLEVRPSIELEKA